MKTYVSPAHLVIAVCVTLGACTDEPSESAMRQAMSNGFAKIAQTYPAARIPTLSHYRKIGCQAAQPPAAPGHLCEYEFAFVGVGINKASARYFKGPDGTLTMEMR